MKKIAILGCGQLGSIVAFADADFYAQACATAKAHGGRIYLPHGAVGGFDVLHTVTLMAKVKNQPITAEIAGWSIVSLLQNLAGPVVLF